MELGEILAVVEVQLYSMEISLLAKSKLQSRAGLLSTLLSGVTDVEMAHLELSGTAPKTDSISTTKTWSLQNQLCSVFPKMAKKACHPKQLHPVF